MKMRAPDATKFTGAEPQELRDLVMEAGLSQQECARRLGINGRTMRRYLAGDLDTPYLVFYGLKALARLK